MSVFSDRLKQLRDEKGEQLNRKVTQEEVANDIGIKAQSLGRYEKDSRKPDIDIACKFADYYGVSVDYLLGRDIGSTPTITEIMRITGLTEKAIKNILRDNYYTDINKRDLNFFFENVSLVKWVTFYRYHFYEEYLSLQNEKAELIAKQKAISKQAEEYCADGEEDKLNALSDESSTISEQIQFKLWQMDRLEKYCLDELMRRTGLKAGED